MSGSNQSQQEPDAPTTVYRTDLDDLKSEVRYLKEILATGSKMRKQTLEERAANPTVYGYARFVLSVEERKELEYRIELLEDAVWRIRKNSM